MKPLILIVDADRDFRRTIGRLLLTHLPSEILETTGARDAIEILATHHISLGIIGSPADGTDGLDVVSILQRRKCSVPLIFVPLESSEALAIAALRSGVTDYLRRPFSAHELAGCVHRCLNRMAPGVAPEIKCDPSLKPPHMVGDSHAMRSAMAAIDRVAPTNSTVLITGETGTGKELAAELVHFYSPRRHKPLVRINCAAIPDTLLESELFGYERGAFTGAHAMFEGKLRRADGGTVFFDEVGDMTPFAQAKLLRVIENREADRLGGSKTMRLDIRVSAATNQELEPLLAQGRFRKDLFFRLNVVRIHLPALRERKEDIPSLVDHYLRELNLQLEARIAGLTPSALEALTQYDWPGNVRELKNLLEALIVDRPFGIITPASLPPHIRCHLTNTRTDSAVEGASAERERVLSALFDARWNKCEAAKRLRWCRMTLYRKMAKYHISLARSSKPSARQLTRTVTKGTTVTHS